MLIIGSDEGEQTEVDEAEVKLPKDPIWENHFEDAEKMTTVTVIEDFNQIDLENTDPTPPRPTTTTTAPAPKSKPSHPEQKKKKAFRYGTKAERQSDRKKLKEKKKHHQNSKKKKSK